VVVETGEGTGAGTGEGVGAGTGAGRTGAGTGDGIGIGTGDGVNFGIGAGSTCRGCGGAGVALAIFVVGFGGDGLLVVTFGFVTLVGCARVVLVVGFFTGGAGFDTIGFVDGGAGVGVTRGCGDGAGISTIRVGVRTPNLPSRRDASAVRNCRVSRVG